MKKSVGGRRASRCGIGTGGQPIASADPIDFGKSILTVLARAAARPTEVTGAWLAFANAMEYTADRCPGRHSIC